MASAVEVVNVALTLLGESRIMNLSDNTKPAREANALFEFVRDGELANYNWSFAMKRAQLPALAEAPAFGYTNAFQFPSDCLRLVFIGDYYVGADLSDYRSAPQNPWMIEGRSILSDESAPLNVRYVSRVTDPTLFTPPFVMVFGAKLAMHLAEPLTQSGTKRQQAEAAYKEELSKAIRANAIELPPEKLPDDEWMLSRL